jgi:hypothetical protein
MRRQLLVSTATAALLSGLVFASAQEMPRGGGKQEGTIQNQGSQQGGAQRGESRQGMPQRQNVAPSTQGQRSQAEQGKAKQQAQPKPDMNRNQQQQGQRDQGKAKQQAQPKPDQDRNKQRTTGQGQRDQGKTKQQAQPRPDQNRDRQQTTGQGQRDQSKQQAQPKTEQGRDQTVGQGRQQQDRQQSRQDGGDRTSARGSVNLTAEQRTRIRETIISRSDAPRVDNVNFRIAVGTSIPARVRLVAVPREIVEIRPQFRNHQYFVVRDEIVIVDSRRRIVEVIPVESAGGSGPAIRGSGSRADVAIDLTPDEIIEVQRVLVQRGFSVEVDGRLGPRTRHALIQFQRREGLQVTGRIDSRTVSSLGVSVRSIQGGAQQPATTGQGGAAGQGSGAAQQPSQPNQGTGQSQGNPSQSPSPTTGQGSGTSQNPSANQGSGAGQGGASNPAAKQAPSNGGASGSGSMPSGQQPK